MSDYSANIQLNTFLLEAKDMLADMERYHDSKRRQIEHSFQTLYDNIPKDLLNFPVQMSIESYLSHTTKKAFDELELNESVNEFDDEKDKFAFFFES